MANTGRPRAASWVRNQSSRRTASAGGTGLSYRSPASSTPSTGWASSRARICSRMYFWSSSMENSHTRLPRCRSERCAKRKSEHRLSKNCCSYYIAGRALAATLSVTASLCEKGLPENPQIFRKPRIKTIFSSELPRAKRRAFPIVLLPVRTAFPRWPDRRCRRRQGRCGAGTAARRLRWRLRTGRLRSDAHPES